VKNLGKEIVQNISIARFTNTVLEPLWNNKFIDHVQIILTEDFGIEDRGGFYDKYGALKDVVQNHMLQLLSLTAMEAPTSLNEENIRDQKIKVLRAVRNPEKNNIILGQYEGYKKEKGVKPNSKTSTFVASKLFINNKRWKNVPFYLITGKNMKNKTAGIYIEFKQAKCRLFDKGCKFTPNHLVIQIQPNQGIYMGLNAKSPGNGEIVPVNMNFSHERKFGLNSPEAYENLIEDVIKGNQAMFIRTDEVEEQWRIIDKIDIEKLKVNKYKKKDYPTEAKKFIEKDCRSWHLEVK